MITAFAAAHVEDDHIAIAACPAQTCRTDDTACRTGSDNHHGEVARRTRREHAAVRCHDKDRRHDANFREPPFQLPQIAAHGRQQIGVDDRRAGALVLLHLRQHSVGRRNRQIGEARIDQRLGLLLVCGIAIAVEEADRDGFDAVGDQLLCGSSDIGLRQRMDHRAVGSNALRHFEPMAARHERFGLVPGEIEHVGHAYAPDFEHITEAARRDQTGPRARPLQDGVRSDSRAVQDFGNAARRSLQLGEERGEPLDDAAARIIRRGRYLALVQDAVGRHDDDVGESTADIDSNAHCGLISGHEASSK